MAKELDNKKMWESVIKYYEKAHPAPEGLITCTIFDDALREQGFEYKNGKIVSIESEIPNFILEKGNKYLCIKDYFSACNDDFIFRKGKIYESDATMHLITDDGSSYKWMLDCREYFRLVTEDEIPQDSKRIVSAEEKESLYDKPEQANWTNNYDWNGSTMAIYNLSKEEHLKIVEFLDSLRHPDIPETDSREKEDKIGLTEFERELMRYTNEFVDSKDRMAERGAKYVAKRLLEIARKTILSEKIEQAYKTRDEIQYHDGLREGVDIACSWLYDRYDRQGYLDYDDLRDCKEALEKEAEK